MCVHVIANNIPAIDAMLAYWANIIVTIAAVIALCELDYV
jgi:hypothetical protein